MAGLDEVLASFSGAGGLYTAIADLADREFDWNADAVRIRAHRVLTEELAPHLARWPASAVEWIDALPAQSSRRRESGPTPRGRVDWVRTRMSGWPPQSYYASVRERLPDGILTSAFAWTVAQVSIVSDDARKAYAEVDRTYRDQLATARTVMTHLGGDGLEADPPGRPEFAALRASGRPWTALADVAEILHVNRSSLAGLARELLLPDPEVRGLLFHLACIGEALLALRCRGWSVTSVRPIGIGSGPVFAARRGQSNIDVWCEVAAAFRYYGTVSPYTEATSLLGAVSKPIGADIGFFDTSGSALLLECKYSDSRTYVVRNGYEQALAYLAECRTALAERAEAAVIGPEEVVTAAGSTLTNAGRVSVLPASGIEGLVTDWADRLPG